jgi:cyclopropane-fatty-acyl-phospholipid synthase
VHTVGSGEPPVALLRVHDSRFYRRALGGGEVGLGESYVDGEWSTPDLVGLLRLMLVNRDVLDALPAGLGWAARIRDARQHRSRRNTRDGSRGNIHSHYDLGNEFFRLFLDANLLYSCGLYERADDTLEQAQINKLRRICDKLQLGPGDRVLEIGTGWGGFALYAATRYGCHVTTTTISREQHAYAAAQFAQAGRAGARIDLRLDDYRDLEGRFDKIVSIEMFEAVGLEYYDQFFAACERLIAPDGVMLLQAITVDDWRFADYRRTPNWISKHVFPGAELASVAEILGSVARVSRFGLHHAQQIGIHYARTLHHWRQRFQGRLDEVRRKGFDDRFIRMWDLYLAYCEAAFAERHIGDVQLLFARTPSRRPVFDEWQAPSSLLPAHVSNQPLTKV